MTTTRKPFKSPAYEARLAFGAAYIEGMDYVGLSALLGDIRERAVRIAARDDSDPQDHYMEAARQAERVYRAPR